MVGAEDRGSVAGDTSEWTEKLVMTNGLTVTYFWWLLQTFRVCSG